MNKQTESIEEKEDAGISSSFEQALERRLVFCELIIKRVLKALKTWGLARAFKGWANYAGIVQLDENVAGKSSIATELAELAYSKTIRSLKSEVSALENFSEKQRASCARKEAEIFRLESRVADLMVIGARFEESRVRITNERDEAIERAHELTEELRKTQNILERSTKEASLLRIELDVLHDSAMKHDVHDSVRRAERQNVESSVSALLEQAQRSAAEARSAASEARSAENERSMRMSSEGERMKATKEAEKRAVEVRRLKARCATEAREHAVVLVQLRRELDRSTASESRLSALLTTKKFQHEPEVTEITPSKEASSLSGVHEHKREQSSLGGNSSKIQLESTIFDMEEEIERLRHAAQVDFF